MFYFCVACESPRAQREYVEVYAHNEHEAIHKASKVKPGCEYRLVLPEPVVEYKRDE